MHRSELHQSWRLEVNIKSRQNSQKFHMINETLDSVSMISLEEEVRPICFNNSEPKSRFCHNIISYAKLII